MNKRLLFVYAGVLMLVIATGAFAQQTITAQQQLPDAPKVERLYPPLPSSLLSEDTAITVYYHSFPTMDYVMGLGARYLHFRRELPPRTDPVWDVMRQQAGIEGIEPTRYSIKVIIAFRYESAKTLALVLTPLAKKWGVEIKDGTPKREVFFDEGPIIPAPSPKITTPNKRRRPGL